MPFHVVRYQSYLREALERGRIRRASLLIISFALVTMVTDFPLLVQLEMENRNDMFTAEENCSITEICFMIPDLCTFFYDFLNCLQILLVNSYILSLLFSKFGLLSFHESSDIFLNKL